MNGRSGMWKRAWLARGGSDGAGGFESEMRNAETSINCCGRVFLVRDMGTHAGERVGWLLLVLLPATRDV